jgi:hypothetical protein
MCTAMAAQQTRVLSGCLQTVERSVDRSGPGQTAYFIQEVSNLEPLVFFSAVDSPLRAISKM